MDRLTPDQKFKMAEVVAAQIWIEQQLTSSRMTWNLTFQGFLLAGFALIFKESEMSQQKTAVLLIVASFGSIIATWTLFSIRASQIQRDYHKGVWRSLYGQEEGYFFPRPFSETTVSAMGRHTPDRTLWSIIAMWVALSAATVLLHNETPKPAPERHAAIQASADRSYLTLRELPRS